MTASRREETLEVLFETAAVGLVSLDGGGRVVRAKPVSVGRTEDCAIEADGTQQV